MKDSRSSTASPRSIIETIREEMANVCTENRYGGGPATKTDLIKIILDWRSRLPEEPKA